ncbi:hypothetical protein [Burkholderia sp. PU8-34]
MSAELSGMVYDGPMTMNQSIINRIEMIIFRQEFLKFSAPMPLTIDPAYEGSRWMLPLAA